MKTLILIPLFFLISCIEKESQHSREPESNRPVMEHKYRYEFASGETTQNAECSTHLQQFNSIGDLCLGLQDNRLNNYCALELRQDYFKAMCPNQVFKSFDSGLVQYY